MTARLKATVIVCELALQKISPREAIDKLSAIAPALREARPDDLVCLTCGSDQLQYEGWLYVNGDTDAGGAPGNQRTYFCPECDDHVNNEYQGEPGCCTRAELDARRAAGCEVQS